jgi:hypothetical protein
MRLIKNCCLCLLVCTIFILTGCSSEAENPKKELYLAPHSYNDKITGYEKYINYTLIANFNIEVIDDLEFAIERSNNASFDDIRMDKLIFVDDYKGYDIYQLSIQILGLTGSIKFNQVTFTVNDSIEYTFSSDVYFTDDYEKDVHIYSGDGSADIVVPGFSVLGYQAILTPTADIIITDIYFEGTDEFNLTEYIETIIVNEQLFDNNIEIRKSEIFSIDIQFKTNTPKDYAIIDQLMAKYRDLNSLEEKEAYILVPIILFDSKEVGKYYIDNRLINN